MAGTSPEPPAEGLSGTGRKVKCGTAILTPAQSPRSSAPAMGVPSCSPPPVSCTRRIHHGRRKHPLLRDRPRVSRSYLDWTACERSRSPGALPRRTDRPLNGGFMSSSSRGHPQSIGSFWATTDVSCMLVSAWSQATPASLCGWPVSVSGWWCCRARSGLSRLRSLRRVMASRVGVGQVPEEVRFEAAFPLIETL